MSDGDSPPYAAIGGGIGGATGAALAATTDAEPAVGILLALGAGFCLAGGAVFLYARLRD